MIDDKIEFGVISKQRLAVGYNFYCNLMDNKTYNWVFANQLWVTGTSHLPIRIVKPHGWLHPDGSEFNPLGKYA